MLDDWRFFKSKGPKKTFTKYKNDNSKITIEDMKSYFQDSSDVKYKEMKINERTLNFIYIENIVDRTLIDQNILKPILSLRNKKSSLNTEFIDDESIFDKIEKGLVPHVSTNIRTNIDDAIKDILDGSVCLIESDIYDRLITFSVKKIEKRSITEPSSENIIKGSKEAFIEQIAINISLIRNNLKTTDLKVKEIIVGNELPTKVAIVYLENVVDKEMLGKVEERIKNISTNKLVASDIEEQIVEKKYSIFPQLSYTEKTDKVVENIVEGKIGILVDGLPFVYIVPAILTMFLQAPEDYSINYFVSSCLRVLRYIGVFFSLIISGFYVAITTFHQEMIPTQLSESISSSKQGTPFPVVIEVLFMLFAFEVLIEASARLPKTIGQTISIVGGLIVGEAAVNAHFVSPAVVVIVAITGITGFLIPNQDLANALRVCRFVLVIFSSIAGLYGLALGITILLYYLATIESFGVPYFAPFSSNDGKNILYDTVIRRTLVDMRNKKK